jgi:DNA-directed RNA polymerase specialized sigma24 family protein
MTTLTIDSRTEELAEDRSTRRDKQSDSFADSFSRCRNTLHFMADLILNNSELADRAVHNCWEKASRNAPSFESEGDFCGWIFRVLINEALVISPGRYQHWSYK